MNATADRDAFVRAIIAEPDDDAPRLVFADWLDENGEPQRAEFIRVQVALAQLAEGESDPDRRTREGVLLQRHSATWLAELPTLAGVKPEGFHRGFIQQVTFANLKAFRLHAATVSQHPVRAVTFRTLTPGTTRSLANMAELTHVRSLSLRRSGADAASLAELFYSPHLANLRRLALEASSIEPEVMEAIGQHLVNLEVLSIKSSALNNECLAVLARVAALPRLRELHLPENSLGDAGVVALADARGLPALHRLKLDYNNVSDAGIVALARSPHLGALRHLSLYQTSVSGEGLAALMARISLESVDWKSNSLVTGLPSTGSPRTLIGPPAEQRKLHLWSGVFGDAAFTALVGSPGFETITELSLSSNPVTGEGLRALAGVSRPIALRQFKLSTSVSAASVEAILLAPQLAQLDLLSLWVSGGGDREPASEIPSLPATVILSVAGNQSSFAWLARSASLRRVRDLSVDAAALPILIPSPHLAALEALTVSSTTTVQIRALLGSSHPRRFKRLTLRFGKQGDAKARLLANAANLVGLQELEVVNEKVGDEGALALAASPYLGGLWRLDLRRNAISTDAVRQLRQRFGERVLLSEPEVAP